MYKNNAIIIA